MLSRRRFLLGTTAISLLSFPTNAEAWSHGSSVPTNSNTVLNFGGFFPNSQVDGYINLAKWAQPASTDVGFLGQFSGANNYPNGTLATNQEFEGNYDPAYYGRFVLSFTGQGGYGPFAGGGPLLVYSGATASGVTVSGFNWTAIGSGGWSEGNLIVEGTAGCSLQFSFGFMVNAVSGGSGSPLQFTASQTGIIVNLGGIGVAGTPVSPNLLTYNGGAFPTGPNSDGSWTLVNVDNTNFTLQGSSALNASLVALNTSGTPGTNTEFYYSIFQTGNVGLPATTYSSFANLAIYKTVDAADFAAGKLATSRIKTALGAAKPAYLRFLDASQVENNQGIYAFADRTTPSSFTWGTVACPHGYWAGQLTNTSDAYSCSNPANSPSSGGYLDGEVVVAQVGASGQNTTYNPTLNVGGRGAAPITSTQGNLLNLFLGGSVGATGTTVSIVFNGGGVSSYTHIYTVQSSDTSLGAFKNNLVTSINGDTTLSSKGISASGSPTLAGAFEIYDPSVVLAFTYNRNVNSSGVASLGAGMTITASDNGGATTYTIGLVAPSLLGNSGNVAFTYNVLLGAWLALPYFASGTLAGMGGVRGGPPLEYYEELCTSINAGMWYQFGITASSSVISATVTHIANSGVKALVIEFSNETWNSSLTWPSNQTVLCNALAASLGLTEGYNVYSGLRTIQLAQQATAAWAAAGRSRSSLKITSAYQYVSLQGNNPTFSDVYNYRFNGTSLTPGSNVTLAAYGGPANGTAAPTAWSLNASVAPNRPVDWSDWISPAPYWFGGELNSGNGNDGLTGGVLSNYNGILLAGYNYAYGTSAQKTAALDFLYQISSQTGDLYNGTLNGVVNNNAQLASWANGSGDTNAEGYWGVGVIAAGYDSSRSSTGTSGGAQAKLGVACYEGGWAMGPISNTNGVSQYANSLTSLGYTNGYSSSLSGAATGGPTGSSDTATLAATNIANLLVAWKNDGRALALLNLTYGQFKAAVNSGGVRDALVAQYGFQGPNDWASYPGTATQSGPFQVVPALAAFN